MIELRGKICLSQQEELLKKCIDNSLSLDLELECLGLDYDGLRYRSYPPLYYSNTPFKALEDYDIPYHGVPSVSFFSGAGGFDLGFKRAGYNNLATIEISQDFCDTLRKNHQGLSVIGPPDYSGDICNREELAATLREEIGVEKPFGGVFHGGPPCQPFSIAANQRFCKDGENFKRIGFSDEEHGNLLFDFVWFIKEFEPIAFLIENVTGLLKIDDGEQLSEAIELLVRKGYAVTGPTILDTSNYGIPQKRIRLFICGTRLNKRFQFPYKDSAMVPCMRVLEKPLNGVQNHVTRKHKAESIIRYMELDYGKREPLGRVDRLDPQLPSKTVIAGGAKGGGRSHLHPFIPRTLSVRESARLQTFPDNYIFCGSPARQFTQVGNAVPPLLGLKLANTIYQQIFE